MKFLKLFIELLVLILILVDYNKIFYKLDELYIIYIVFYNDLEVRVLYWIDRYFIGDLFLSLVSL